MRNSILSMLKPIALSIAAIAIIGLGQGVAKADPCVVLISNGTLGGGNEMNVLFTNDPSAVAINQTLTAVFNSGSSASVFFRSSTSGIDANGGQATIFDSNTAAGEGSFTDLTISFAAGTGFTSIGFNVDLVNSGSAGLLTVSGFDEDGTAFTTTFAPNFSAVLSTTGQNFYTVMASAGCLINSITISSGLGTINEVRQIRIEGGSAPPAAAVPEPATMLLLGTGLVGAAGAVRRRVKAGR